MSNSVNTSNASPANPFVNLDSLKNAGLTENEYAVLSHCQYEDLKGKWDKGLNNISTQAHTHIGRHIKEVKEGIFRQLGAAMGFFDYEPWKQTEQIFSNWRSFDSYVRFNIKLETYQKIAKANPQYFDKVIGHLEHVANELDKRANIRIGTFCSNQSGQTLAMLASDFRSTAAFLRLKMNGGDVAKPENNNSKTEADRGQPTVINHYHNNIGHIGDINIGHPGDNHFHNKNGKIFMQFNGSPNNIRHAGFKSGYPTVEPQNSYYSPVINGSDLLRLNAEQTADLALQGNKNKGKKLEIQRNEGLTFEAEKPLPKNLEKTAVDSMSFTAEERKNIEMSNPKEIRDDENNNTEGYITKTDLEKIRTTKTDLKTYAREPNEPQPSPVPKKTENVNHVQSETNSLETIFDELKSLRDKYYRLWDKIHQDKGSKTALATNNNSVEARVAVFNNDHRIKNSDNSFDKLLKLGRQIENLNKTLETLKQNLTIDRNRLSTVSPILNQIARMIGNNKKEALEHEIPKETGKSDLADKRHGLTWRTEVENQILSEKEQKMSPDEVRNLLVDETQKTIDNIKNHLETLKKETHPQNAIKRKPQSKRPSSTKETNVQPKSNQSSARERMQQFGKDIEIRNRNLPRRSEKREEPPKPSAREKREEYQNNTVDPKNANMRQNPFDPNTQKWIPNDGKDIQRTADNERYKTFNANVTDPSFHQHNS